MKTQIPVRRSKSGNGWCIADGSRANFVGGFRGGIMSDVQFIQNAKPMLCIAGYESTGEAVGDLVNEIDVPVMPADAVRTAEVAYDGKNRSFHIVGKPDEKVEEADYLLLFPDGKATAGWIL